MTETTEHPAQRLLNSMKRNQAQAAVGATPAAASEGVVSTLEPSEPGPWCCSVTTETTGASGDAIAFIHGPETRVRGRMVGFSPTDARLIAAAPDMRSALVDTLFLLDGLADGDMVIGGETHQATLATIRAALARAAG